MELLTPPGVAGVAVVRVAAAERAPVLACLRGARRGVAWRAVLRIDEVDIDDVLVVDRGAFGLELHVHGAPAVLAALRLRFGLVLAHPHSSAERLMRMAMATSQLELAFEQRTYDFAAELAKLAALPTAARRGELVAARVRSRHAIAQIVPVRVVLVGRQNAGKSTLFNRLVARERVVTGATPGLTRDPVAETTVLDDYPYELVDTAGEGDVPSPVDAAALQAGRDLQVDALVVLVVDASSAWSEVDAELAGRCHLVVANKCDRPVAEWPAGQRCDLRISAEHDPLPTLRMRFGCLLRTHRGLPPGGSVGGFAAMDAAEAARLDGLD